MFEQFFTGYFGQTKVASLTHNPLDSTTYFVGEFLAAPTTTTGGPVRCPFPIAGNILLARLSVLSTVAGSAETGSAYIRINDTTDILISDSVTWDGTLNIYAVDLTTPPLTTVASPDFFELKIVTPAWVLNPLGVLYVAAVWVGPDSTI